MECSNYDRHTVNALKSRVLVALSASSGTRKLAAERQAKQESVAQCERGGHVVPHGPDQPRPLNSKFPRGAPGSGCLSASRRNGSQAENDCIIERPNETCSGQDSSMSQVMSSSYPRSSDTPSWAQWQGGTSHLFAPFPTSHTPLTDRLQGDATRILLTVVQITDAVCGHFNSVATLSPRPVNAPTLFAPWSSGAGSTPVDSLIGVQSSAHARSTDVA